MSFPRTDINRTPKYGGSGPRECRFSSERAGRHDPWRQAFGSPAPGGTDPRGPFLRKPVFRGPPGGEYRFPVRRTLVRSFRFAELPSGRPTSNSVQKPAAPAPAPSRPPLSATSRGWPGGGEGQTQKMRGCAFSNRQLSPRRRNFFRRNTGGFGGFPLAGVDLDKACQRLVFSAGGCASRVFPPTS